MIPLWIAIVFPPYPIRDDKVRSGGYEEYEDVFVVNICGQDIECLWFVKRERYGAK